MGNIKGVDVIYELKVKKSRSVNETPSQSYGVRLPFGGSHSVTCHPIQVNTPLLNPSQRLVLLFTYPREMEGLVTYCTKMVYPHADGHPSKYSARPGVKLTIC